MTFQTYRYERPNLQELEGQFKALLASFNQAQDADEQNGIISTINQLRHHFYTKETLVSIRHSVDTRDEFYKAEQEYFDEINPIVQEYITDYYRAITGSKFRKELEEHWGAQLFRLAEMSLKIFSPEIIEDLQQENKLSTQYSQLIASAKIPFEGEERTLSQLIPFEQSTDRGMRERAAEARYQFMAEHEQALDGIFDELVKVRTTIARKLGYDNFVELGYARMSRLDYDAEMVRNFRDQVAQYIVPVATKLKEHQRSRIQVEQLRYYDDGFNFLTGNPTPKGDPDWIVENGAKMYHELSPETDRFFTFMQENELMDLVSKQGKQSGGYCTYWADYKAPFIFSNFNGTSFDIDVLTHEVGHAFQVFESRESEVPNIASRRMKPLKFIP